ncbi:MAG: type IV secretory system conjugative DNA transfer family protein, partial [Clostridiales bacterium]|nr:type IV secretory system conjugative DNA transfer family protein [Clostridiales bacterium]
MLRISQIIAKLEDRIDRKIGRYLSRNKGILWQYGALGGVGLYFYSMFVNSIRVGISSTFSMTTPSGNLFEWNPFVNLAALFTPTGLGVTFVAVLMTMLINKKGYHILSGYKFEKDKRGFDILPDGTHGTSGFMQRKAMDAVLDYGKVDDLNGTILGKMKDDLDDADQYSDYVTLKKNSGLNDHIMVFGASGAGKSRGFVKPFVLQTAARRESIILVDPKGDFFESMSEFLRNEGYEVKAFNLLDMANSDGWNIMADIETDKNLVQSMAEVIIRNTSNASEKQDFWEKAELNLFMALIHYVQGLKKPGTSELLPIEQRSLGAIYKMLSSDSFAQIEQIMGDLPNTHPAKAPYGIFRLANRQIWGNIAIGLGNRLGVFQNESINKITKYNEIDLELPGRKPCAYFCIISDQDSSLEFLSSLFFSTLFVRLTNYARRYGENGRLPIKVNVCLDVFCNVGKI